MRETETREEEQDAKERKKQEEERKREKARKVKERSKREADTTSVTSFVHLYLIHHVLLTLPKSLKPALFQIPKNRQILR